MTDFLLIVSFVLISELSFFYWEGRGICLWGVGKIFWGGLRGGAKLLQGQRGAEYFLGPKGGAEFLFARAKGGGKINFFLDWVRGRKK